MTFKNNPHLRRYLSEAGMLPLLVYECFELDAVRFELALAQVRAQHPYLDETEAAARAGFRVIDRAAKKGQPKPRTRKRLGIRFWLMVAAIVISGLLAGLLCTKLHAEPQSAVKKTVRVPQVSPVETWGIENPHVSKSETWGTPTSAARQRVRLAQPTSVRFATLNFRLSTSSGIRNALRGANFLTMPAAPQQPSGIIIQFRNSGSTLATRPAGLVIFDCGSNMSCSFSGSTFTLTSTGAGGGCTPPGTSGRFLYDTGTGCADSAFTWNNATSTATAPAGVTLTYSGTGIINARNWSGTGITNTESFGKIPIGNGDGTASWSDPFVSGITAHDAVGTSTNPVLIGGYASAAAPADVSADGDAVRAWLLRNGSQVVNLAAAGALIPGDATNGLKVQVTTAPTTAVSQSGSWSLAANQSMNVAQFGGTNTVTGTGASGAGIPRVTISNDSSLAANQSVNANQIGGNSVLTGNGATGTGSQRVTLASDNSAIANWGLGATGSAVPSGAQYIAGDGSGNLTAPLTCDSYAFYDASTSGATQLVALTSAQNIYVCGYSFTSSSTTANTLKLVYGTGTNCATGQTAMTPGVVLQSAAGSGPIGKVIPVSGWSRGLKTAASNALCLLTNAAAAAQAEVWYTKF